MRGRAGTAQDACKTAGMGCRAVSAAVITIMQYFGSRNLRSAVGEFAATWQVMAAIARYGASISDGATTRALQSLAPQALVASARDRTEALPAAMRIDVRLMGAAREVRADGAAEALHTPPRTLVSIK